VKKTTRFVIWICSKFTRREIEQIIQGLMEVLANRNPEVKPMNLPRFTGQQVKSYN